ncbi:MAG: Uma2 family endonuclease [Leptospiraceae bacterium]|nr:Uma2 family endonuclease [Leptospiraceae bacterium]
MNRIIPMIVFDTPTAKKSSYADYLNTPEGSKFQLIGGEIIEMTSPNLYHQEILLNLCIQFKNYLQKNKSGKLFIAPLDVYLSETEVYQPDLFVLLKENFSKMQETKIEGAPDLVVEVLSPSTAYYDMKHKKSVYEKFGVKEYWIVDPMQKTLEIYFNQDSKFQLQTELTQTQIAKSILLPELEINLNEVF